jgi:hypothetical protein
MRTVTLQEAYRLLKSFKHCLFEDESSTLSAKMRNEGLVLKIKSNVILFPYENNTSVVVNDDTITLTDVNNWDQMIKPLIPAQLI